MKDIKVVSETVPLDKGNVEKRILTLVKKGYIITHCVGVNVGLCGYVVWTLEKKQRSRE